jgi:A/G-specific adenine glycosylase
MLQQTQVVTVTAYFARFIDRFPDVASLALAHLDDVLALWSGLGYYSRARNLHRCAQMVMERHGGVFPQTADVLETLPGIGRSTAAAISSLCFGERVAILDANVRRVVTRVAGFGGDLALSANVKTLWALATNLLPAAPTSANAMARYTQGMMDLGATVCLPKKPDCANCAVRSHCTAGLAGNAQDYPVRTRTLKRSSQSIWLLCVRSDTGAIWLNQRPTPGVWAGLYCMPLFDSVETLHAAVAMSLQSALQPLAVFKHVLTHKDLHLHPWELLVREGEFRGGEGRWVGSQDWPRLGLPAPIRRLLQDAAPP